MPVHRAGSHRDGISPHPSQQLLCLTFILFVQGGGTSCGQLVKSDVILWHVLETASLCSIAPSLHELDAELAQYSNLLDESEEVADENTALPDFGEGIIADVDPLGVDGVKQLNKLLPSESDDLDRFALRPTAASLGLKDAIKECLGDDPTESGYHCAVIKMQS